ncbi:MAG: hypothetical protein K2X27_14235, partial [Candidatus Obscuribacterales bacterium]|nr:hypothetical protein [Candidatus Obscuribacterales bacterium]
AEVPVEPVVAEVPVEPVVAEVPVEPVVAEVPVEPVVAEAPVEPVVAEAPVEPVVAEVPVAPVVAEAPAETVAKPLSLDDILKASAAQTAPQAAAPVPGISVDKPEPVVASSEEEEEDSSKPQKKLSLQATLAKLEEQSRRAYVRLDEFKKAHEIACSETAANVKSGTGEFESATNERLLQLSNSVIEKLRAISNEASNTLRSFVEVGQKQISEKLPAAIAELELLAAEAGVEAALSELDETGESFQSLCSERLGGTQQEQEAVLSRAVEEELAKLEKWRSGQLKNYLDSFEQSKSRLEQHRIASLSALESCVHSMSEGLRRLRELDTQRLALLNSELSENLEQSCKLAEMSLTRNCDMALAEQILPLLAEWKSNLGLHTRKLRREIEEELEVHSESSLAHFEPVLKLGKESVALTMSSIEELKSSIEVDERTSLDARLADLSNHFENKLQELNQFFVELREKESSGAESKESDQMGKVASFGKECQLQVENVCRSIDNELALQVDTAGKGWEAKADAVVAASAAEMLADIETVRNHRRESLRKLQEKLNKLSTTVQSLQSQLIQ